MQQLKMMGQLYQVQVNAKKIKLLIGFLDNWVCFTASDVRNKLRTYEVIINNVI